MHYDLRLIGIYYSSGRSCMWLREPESLQWAGFARCAKHSTVLQLRTAIRFEHQCMAQHLNAVSKPARERIS